MRRSFITIPIILLILLNACGNDPTQVSNELGTAVANTQTAAVWTPIITPTFDPNESRVVEWLNEHLSNADPLERTLDAKYEVGAVTFPASYTIMRVDTHCQCPRSTQCCSPERMFIMVIRAMKDKWDKVYEQVPPAVNELDVVCFDRGAYITTMAASWSDVKRYLNEEIMGVELAYKVQRK